MVVGYHGVSLGGAEGNGTWRLGGLVLLWLAVVGVSRSLSAVICDLAQNQSLRQMTSVCVSV